MLSVYFQITNQGSFLSIVKLKDPTACESHDLSLDLCLIYNGFKQLCVMNSMQEF